MLRRLMRIRGNNYLAPGVALADGLRFDRPPMSQPTWLRPIQLRPPHGLRQRTGNFRYSRMLRCLLQGTPQKAKKERNKQHNKTNNVKNKNNLRLSCSMFFKTAKDKHNMVAVLSMLPNHTKDVACLFDALQKHKSATLKNLDPEWTFFRLCPTGRKKVQRQRKKESVQQAKVQWSRKTTPPELTEANDRSE